LLLFYAHLTLGGTDYLKFSWILLTLACWKSSRAEEAKYGLTPSQTRKMKNWEDRLVYPSTAPHMADIKQEISRNGYLHSHGSEEIQASKSPWSRIIPSSSPGSCIAGSFGRNMLDFSNKSERMHHQPANSPEVMICLATLSCSIRDITAEAGVVLKKSRVQGTSSAHSTTFKVTKEKLGDRITALHQIVSPFGKVSPYLIPPVSNLLMGVGEGFMHSDRIMYTNEEMIDSKRVIAFLLFCSYHQEGDDEPKKDLRSRGLCLVPVSFFLDVGSDNGADYWVPTLHGTF
ncbi:hypothetical protein GW17_00011175, partial [Ensete ventricosum]